jgi:predicted AlkP superfamily pyrophosphatase or phosphodiesterase
MADSASRQNDILAPGQSHIETILTDEGKNIDEEDVLGDSRTSHEIREHDREILQEEEEQEEIIKYQNRGAQMAALKSILVKATAALPLKKVVEGIEADSSGRRGRKRRKRKRNKSLLTSETQNGEDRELMFEMEEGGLRERSSTEDISETEALSRQRQQHVDASAQRRRRFRRICCMNITIFFAFTLLLVGAWRLSLARRMSIEEQELLSNGTALFAPTTILVSLDGFRADFLRRGITPRLNAFIEEGVSPIYMLPSFPSVTFPNHYTLVTGLYPESHGIVGNTFWDPDMHEEFSYTKPESSMQPKWWGGEPLWVTAEKQGIRTAIHMWPGSEAHILGVEPSFLDTFNSEEPLSSKVRRVLELLDKPGIENNNVPVDEMRPQFIAAYVPNVDTDGHIYGPNSTEIRKSIADVDDMLDQLFIGLEERNLTNIVNVVVVSDHGMATTDTDRLIQLEDLVDPNAIEHMDGFPLFGLRPKNSADVQGLYDTLASKAVNNPNFDVYLRGVNMPERYHFSKNERIAPLWVVPKTGWAIVTKDEFNVQNGKEKGLVYHPRGLHGYDHEHPLMRAIFVARGPSFPHTPNSRVDVFRKSLVS